MEPNPIGARLVVEGNRRIAIIKMHGQIGADCGFGAHHFCAAVRGLGSYDLLHATLDSTGGSVIDAWIIYDYLRSGPASRYSSVVIIDGQCSGTAMLIAIGFDQILMRPGSSIQFCPVKLTSSIAGPQTTRMIARLIARRTRHGTDEVLAWIDKERKFNADQCLGCSLCEAII
jgi:ATP-dependent protease ClpP protease subunit